MSLTASERRDRLAERITKLVDEHPDLIRGALQKRMEALIAPATSVPDDAPFTVFHFVQWANQLVLDNGKHWAPEPFQLAFVADVFAGVPECWLIVPEGNGKTTLIAGLALYFCEFSQTPVEIPVAASSREQAQVLYRQAEGFVVRTEQLHDSVHSKLQEIRGKWKVLVPRFVALSGYRRVQHYNGSRIQVHAADDRTGDGVIFRLAITDELHRHRNLDLYRTWVGKRSKNGGQVVVISTAGAPGEEFETARERIRQSATDVKREGCFIRAASDEVVLHEYAVPEGADTEDLAIVKGANPFSGITIAALTSKRRSPTMTEQHWRRFTCNLPTRSAAAAISELEWQAAVSREEIPAGLPIWLGLDLGWKFDTTAAVPLWCRDFEHRLFGVARIIVPPRNGRSTDPHEVERALLELHARNPIEAVVMDMTKGEQLAAWIGETLNARVVERGQGNVAASQDYERFMEGLRLGYIKHPGDVGLTRHALNAVARMLPAGGHRFDRPFDSRTAQDQEPRVIDAIVAAAMVHAVAVAELENNYELLESVY